MLPALLRRACVVLSVLLAACSDAPTSSHAFSISAADEENIHNGGGEFVFQVYNLDPNNAQQGQQLWQRADSAINGFLSSGDYAVRFTDGRVGDEILVVYYSLTPDLLFQHDIHLRGYTYGPRFRDAAALPHPPH